ncbi:MAG: class F sortase [Actinomycetota bacterium]
MSSSSGNVRRPGGLRPVAGVIALILILAGAIGVWQYTRDAPAFEAAGQVPLADGPTSPTQISDSASSSPAAGKRITVLEDQSFTPNRLVMTKPKVDAQIIPVGVEDDGALVIPEDPQVVGWWSGGASPGSPVGTVVLSSHVTTKAGPGAMLELRTAPIGSRVVVQGPEGSQSYEVQARQRYAKDALPWKQLFAQGKTPRLVLITCDEFNTETRRYLNNVVVVATPISS